MTRTVRVAYLFVLTAVVGAPSLFAQAVDKRPLEIADYRLWRTIEGAAISDDGRWTAWTYSKVRGDDTLAVRSLDTDARHDIPRASDGMLSSDGAWVAYSLAPDFREIGTLERDGDPVPRQAGLMNLLTGESLTWDDADSFGFSETGSHFFVKKRLTAGNRHYWRPTFFNGQHTVLKT